MSSKQEVECFLLSTQEEAAENGSITHLQTKRMGQDYFTSDPSMTHPCSTVKELKGITAYAKALECSLNWGPLRK